ncbi:leucine-rich repeat protein [Treponema sp. OMZ 788]|uniref:leucine-rich repeat protein n=1 Tax=Treponema sp. OMZ 788 TaxID=2563664 RepID=UPI0020A5F315|nr:leucine-rich repeat protein [Treponema sp. OMZ 788]UTC64128.1 leucine-rich repeat protein [Treponema sp. OMZ 788]
MAKCKVCGFRLTDEMKKCPMCGAIAGSTKAGNIAEDANLPRYFCPSCKAQIIGEHRYCPSCMKDLSQAAKNAEVQEQGSNNCIQCGASLPVGAQFCHKCGARQEALSSVKPTKDNAPNVSVRLKETPLEVFKYQKNGIKYILTGIKYTSPTDIVIPSVFSTIGRKAFENCSRLTSITIPNSVTEIRWRAFYGCSSLTDITIPNSVTEIATSTFKNCIRLTSITIPNSVTEIGDWAFGDCRSLMDITIPSSVIKIGHLAFAGCMSLKNVSIENTNFNKFDIARIFGYLPRFTKVTIGDRDIFLD